MGRQDNRNMIAALLREREGYQRRGMQDRVDQVDEQLEHYGYDDPTGREPRGRTAPASSTADASAPAKPAATKAKAAPAAKRTAAQARGAAAETADGDDPEGGSGGEASADEK